MTHDQYKATRWELLRILLPPSAAVLVPIAILQTIAWVDFGFWLTMLFATLAILMMLGGIGASIGFLATQNRRAAIAGYGLGFGCGLAYFVYRAWDVVYFAFFAGTMSG